jgi:ketosteroid isomerase-like protein
MTAVHWRCVAEPSFSYGAPSGARGEVEVVRRLYEAFARRDLNALVDHVADDFELLPTGTARLVGRATPYVGRAGVKEYFEDASRAWSQLEIRADDIRAVAGSVVVFGRVTGVPAGTTVPVERRVLWTWRLRDGRVVFLGVNDLGGA